MSEELVIKHCSPTLAGLKTANMFTCSYENYNELKAELSDINKVITKKGIRAIPLKFSEKKALIYIYRPERLEKDLADTQACKVLKSCGYECKNCEKCILKLIERLETSEGFPHEIGLFLGYPPEDVIGFIEKKECLMTGFWKVYGDTEKAEKKFEQFRKCMKIYYSRWTEGSSLEKLTVSG